MNFEPVNSHEKTAIQLCHDYKIPFFDVAQQYSDVLKNEGYKVVTVFLRGDSDADIEKVSISDETMFLGLSAREIKGLKIRLIFKLIRLCRQWDVCLIVAHRSKAIYLSSLAAFFLPHVKILGVAHRYGFYQRINRKLLAYMCKDNLRLIGVSNAIRDDMRKALPGFNKQYIQTLYNRLDLANVVKELYSRKEARKRLNIPQGQYAFVNVGRLHPDKDQQTLVAAFAEALPRMENTHLYIVGKGRLEAQLKAQVGRDNLNDKITFLGFVLEVYRYMKAFDCFVLSSDHEPFGMVLLEAIAANLPIITTDCGGAVEINNSKAVFPVGDTKMLARLLIEYRNMPADKRSEFVNPQFRYAESRFSYDAARRSFSELLSVFFTALR